MNSKILSKEPKKCLTKGQKGKTKGGHSLDFSSQVG